MDCWSVLEHHKILCLVFECVWLEDGIYPEYTFSSAFRRQEEVPSHFAFAEITTRL